MSLKSRGTKLWRTLVSDDQLPDLPGCWLGKNFYKLIHQPEKECLPCWVPCWGTSAGHFLGGIYSSRMLPAMDNRQNWIAANIDLGISWQILILEYFGIWHAANGFPDFPRLGLTKMTHSSMLWPPACLFPSAAVLPAATMIHVYFLELWNRRFAAHIGRFTKKKACPH